MNLGIDNTNLTKDYSQIWRWTLYSDSNHFKYSQHAAIRLRFTKWMLSVLILHIVAASLTSCTFSRSPAKEIPIDINKGQLRSVLFSVTSKGPYDVELQFLKSAAERFAIVHGGVLSRIIGTATISCEDKTLRRTLPTGWIRGASDHSDFIGTVIVRFWAEPNRQYSLSLDINSVPDELKSTPAMIRILKVTPYFHPGHRVYTLQ